MSEYTIPRAKLLEITDGIALTTLNSVHRFELHEAMTTTSAVAVGWFHCDGANCPMRQIRHANQKFQCAFDQAMFAYFGGSRSIYEGPALHVKVTG